MKLKDLRIRMMEYGPNAGRYVGDVTFADQTGTVQMVLDPDVSNAVLTALSDKFVHLIQKPAREIEQSMKQSIAEANATPALTS